MSGLTAHDANILWRDVNLLSESAVAVPTNVANDAWVPERLGEDVLVRRAA